MFESADAPMPRYLLEIPGIAALPERFGSFRGLTTPEMSEMMMDPEEVSADCPVCMTGHFTAERDGEGYLDNIAQHCDCVLTAEQTAALAGRACRRALTGGDLPYTERTVQRAGTGSVGLHGGSTGSKQAGIRLNRRTFVEGIS